MIALMLAVAGAASQPTFLRPPINFDDIPESALRNGEQGFELVRVLVSPAGIVQKCEIIIPSRYRDLDAQACRLINKAQANPGRDQNGVPVYGIIKTWCSWSIGGPAKSPVTADITLTVNRLPSGLPPTPISKLTLVIDSAGKFESCAVSISSGSEALDNAACSAGVTAADIGAVKDANGVPVRAVIPLDVAFSTAAPRAN